MSQFTTEVSFEIIKNGHKYKLYAPSSSSIEELYEFCHELEIYLDSILQEEEKKTNTFQKARNGIELSKKVHKEKRKDVKKPVKTLKIKDLYE
jgi:hypothetical protein